MTKKTTTATPVLEEVAETEELTFSAKEIATELNIDAKSFRRWLRSHTSDRANKGGRWIFTSESKAQVIAAYNAKGAGTEPTLDTDD